MTEFRFEDLNQSYDIPDTFSAEQRNEVIRHLLETQGKAKQQRELTREETLEAQVPGGFERGRTGTIAEFAVPGARFDVARSSKISEQIAKLKAKYPDMDVREIGDPTGGSVIALRNPGRDQYQLLDSDEFNLFSDSADVAGALLNTETLMAVATAFATRGRSILARAGAQFLGATTGRSADIAIENARGYEHDTMQEITTDVGSSGMLATLGEFIGSGILRGVRTLSGFGFAKLTPEQQAAQKTAQQFGIKGLTPGLIHPLFEGMENQAALMTKPMQEFRLRRLEGFANALSGMRARAGDFSGVSDQELEGMYRSALQGFLSMANVPMTDPALAGKALQRGRNDFVTISRGWIKRRYDRAIAESENVTFDITEVKKLAEQIGKGVEILDKKGIPISGSARPVGETAGIIDVLEQLPDTIGPHQDTTAFEFLKTLRTRSFDAKTAPIVGKEDIQNRWAGQLWSAMTDAMENPAGGSEDFVRLWRAASVANRWQETVLDVADLKAIATSTRPEALIDRIASPAHKTTLRLLARILPEESFQKFRQSFVTKLVLKPEEINQILDKWAVDPLGRIDPNGLRVLLSPNEEATLRVVGSNAERLAGKDAVKAFKAIAALQERALKMLGGSDATQLGARVQAAGGKDSPFGRSMRAAIYQTLLDNTTDLSRGVRATNPEAFLGLVQQLDQAGKLDAVMLPAEAIDLRRMQGLASIIRQQADVGAGMQRGQTSAGAGNIFSPLFFIHWLQLLRAGTTTIKNASIARLFVSPTFRHIVVGTGRSRNLSVEAGIRAMAVVAAETTKDLEQFGLKPENGEKEPVGATIGPR